MYFTVTNQAHLESNIPTSFHGREMRIKLAKLFEALRISVPSNSVDYRVECGADAPIPDGIDLMHTTPACRCTVVHDSS